MRNALAHVPKGQRRMVAALIHTVFAQETKEAAHRQWRKVADQLRRRSDKLGRPMDEAEDDALAFMAYPAVLRTKLYSANPVERVNGEIKRRTDVVQIFPNEKAVTRLVGALLLEQNDEWAVQRRCMPLKTLAVHGNTQTLSLLAVAS